MKLNVSNHFDEFDESYFGLDNEELYETLRVFYRYQMMRISVSA